MAAVLCVEEWLLVLDFLPLPDLVRFALGGHWGHALASTPALFQKFVAAELLLKSQREPPGTNWRDVLQAWRRLLRADQRQCRRQLIARACDASSTDYTQQSILETMQTQSEQFWSSVGSANDDTDETLVYELCEPACIVTELRLRFYRAEWQRGCPTYPARTVAFSLGFRLDDAGALASCHYVSERFPVLNSADPQTFRLPVAVPARYVTVHCHGKVQRQPGDELFYVVLQRVQVTGFPTHALLHQQPLLRWALFTAAQDAGFQQSLPLFRAPLPDYPCARKQPNPRLTTGSHPLFTAVPWVCPALAEWAAARPPPTPSAGSCGSHAPGTTSESLAALVAHFVDMIRLGPARPMRPPMEFAVLVDGPVEEEAEGPPDGEAAEEEEEEGDDEYDELMLF